MLSTEEVARRLGVKPATVYAYVSRGLLTSARNADGKGSLFDEVEVEAFAAGRRRFADAPIIHTGLTLIRDGHLYYRGHDAASLARDHSYESVVTLLWTGELRHEALIPSADLVRLGEAVTAPLPETARLTDRLRVICAAAAAADPLRFDTAPAAVIATGRTMLASMVAALPLRAAPGRHVDPGSHADADLRADADRRVDIGRAFYGARSTADAAADSPAVPLAALLWSRLTADVPGERAVAALNAALVLLADHDMAASTLAARVAASTRAHPYAVVGAGLAALDGPLHGAASGLTYGLLADAIRTGDPVATLSERLRVGGPVPGFGHALYPDGDPRAVTLLGLLGDGPEREIIDAVGSAVTERSGVLPNVDLAIAAFALLNGMAADAGEAIFAVARTAGWLAHALEEYGDRPSRFRPSGRYAGTPPPH